ncbi:sulfatase family protein [Echinicola rosea]|uniref:Acetylglucosamine-6-sulfatase n=1 Tax=Echinicola rosea TaxID=1807691 RepID=A0ABQ1UQ28_9BACT|nr:sulfatase [Echinicola rosea]GGF24423.1 acetylglucosamine-6-sulfatase [Echinicola rosea]
MKNKIHNILRPSNLIAFILFGLVFESCKAEKHDGSKEGQKNGRPNIIYIMADDLTTQAITAYNERFKGISDTPNIDRLAKEGMLFHDVLCTNAICGPSRAAILTGDYSHRNGYYKNWEGGAFDASQWTFPQEFQKAGYATSLFGKWHLNSEPQGFDTYKYHDHHIGGQQGVYWDPVYNENGKKVNTKGYATNLTTDFALDWLDSTQKSQKPFLMLLQYKAPHRSWVRDSIYLDLWKDLEMPYPSTFDDNYTGRENTAGDTEMEMEHLFLETPKRMSKEETKKWRYQSFIKDYLATVKSVDDNIGRVLDYLDEHGLTANTMIVITSDQGFFLGEHGFFDKRFIYEESLRMPFIVRYPNKVKAGSESGDIIGNIDFAATLLDVAGIDTEHKTQGESFASILMGDEPENWRNGLYYHYYEFPMWHHVQPHYGIRTDRYTLAHFYLNVDEWELYDNENDPGQLNNIIDNPEYADVVDHLKKDLTSLMEKYGDDKSLEEFREISNKNFDTERK